MTRNEKIKLIFDATLKIYMSDVEVLNKIGKEYCPTEVIEDAASTAYAIFEETISTVDELEK